jgi:hypothetical protein
MWKKSKVTPMGQTTLHTASVQSTVEQTEDQKFKPQGEDIVLDLRRRLDSFRHTHPYHEIQVAGRRWRYVTGVQGERTLLLLPGSLVPDLFFVPIDRKSVV